jgi:hypothetical protein
MPILTAPPDAPTSSMTPHIAIERDGDRSAVGSAAPPPEDLLPSGGSDHRDASADLPWLDRAFQCRVEAIRAQLRPVRSRGALISSYGREAAGRMIGGLPDRAAESVTPLQVAYALRWLELASPEPRAARWDELLDGPLD